MRYILVGAAICLAVVACVACGGKASDEPLAALPDPPEMPADAALMYWLVSVESPTDEVAILYPDGRVSYEDRAQGRAGSQFVGPDGVFHFTDSLSAVSWGDLQASYRPGKGQRAEDRYVMVAMRDGDVVRQVQWQAPATPAGLESVAAELAQFMDVLRVSAQ